MLLLVLTVLQSVVWSAGNESPLGTSLHRYSNLLHTFDCQTARSYQTCTTYGHTTNSSAACLVNNAEPSGGGSRRGQQVHDYTGCLWQWSVKGVLLGLDTLCGAWRYGSAGAPRVLLASI